MTIINQLIRVQVSFALRNGDEHIFGIMIFHLGLRLAVLFRNFIVGFDGVLESDLAQKKPSTGIMLISDVFFNCEPVFGHVIDN